MNPSDLHSVFGGKHSLKEWNTFLTDANLPDLSRFTDAELEEFKAFVKERHHQDEWEAFFKYVALPPWKRTLSHITGVMIRVLGI